MAAGESTLPEPWTFRPDIGPCNIKAKLPENIANILLSRRNALSIISLSHMTRARTATVLLVSALAVVLTGCIACELRVTNHTGGSIQFYTGHTKKAVQIPAGATRTIPHSSGRVIIITQQDETWEYDTVNIPDFTADTSKGFKRLTLPLTVESSGVVMLPSGRKIEPSQKMKPKQ